MVAIIDYDAGNIKSVEKALLFLGENAVITRDREELLSADRVILPGVGSFGDAMEKLHSYELTEVIHEIVHKGTPFLGICLGLQLLFALPIIGWIACIICAFAPENQNVKNYARATLIWLLIAVVLTIIWFVILASAGAAIGGSIRRYY